MRYRWSRGAGAHTDGAGAGTNGAGTATSGAGFVLGRGPAPAEVHRRPICGAGSAHILEPAPFSPGPAPFTLGPAPFNGWHRCKGRRERVTRFCRENALYVYRHPHFEHGQVHGDQYKGNDYSYKQNQCRLQCVVNLLDLVVEFCGYVIAERLQHSI